MKKNILSAIIVALAFLPAQLSAQQSRTQKIINAALKGWNIELRAGYNLGGTSPIPLPVEIRNQELQTIDGFLCGVGLH